MGKRGNHEGTIRKRKNDYQGSVMLGGIRHWVTGKTKEEVRRKIGELRKEFERGVDLSQRSQTVEEYLRLWLAEVVEPHNRPGTHRRNKGIVEQYLIPAIGHIKLVELTPQHVQKLINDLQKAKYKRGKEEKPLSAQTINNIRSVLRSALNNAMRWQLVSHNAAKHIRLPQVEKFQARPLTHEEARRLEEALRGHPLEALFLIALYLGLRKSELLGLRVEDVDLKGRKLYVRGQLQVVKGKRTFAPPKTAASKRALPIPRRLVGPLERVMEGQREGSFLFTTKNGTPILPRNLSRTFKVVLKRAGLPETIRLHDLRHTVGTNLIELGADVRTTMEVLGHSQVSTTMNTYVHNRDEKKAVVLDYVLENVFGTVTQH